MTDALQPPAAHGATGGATPLSTPITVRPGTQSSDPLVADRVATAALEVPGVVSLHSGSFGEVGTYLPGRRVPGVRLADGRTSVHLTVAVGLDVRVVAEAVRDAVAPLVSSPVDVTVEDVAVV